MATLYYKDPTTEQWTLLPLGGNTAAVWIDFPSAQDTWVVDLGYPVQVTVMNFAGQTVEPGEIVYAGNQVTLHFSEPFSGRAICFA